MVYRPLFSFVVLREQKGLEPLPLTLYVALSRLQTCRNMSFLVWTDGHAPVPRMFVWRVRGRMSKTTNAEYYASNSNHWSFSSGQVDHSSTYCRPRITVINPVYQRGVGGPSKSGLIPD